MRVVGNERETLECPKHLNPRFVLLDMQMSECDGQETCERIRSEARSRSVPVIAVSDSVPKSTGLTVGRVGEPMVSQAVG